MIDAARDSAAPATRCDRVESSSTRRTACSRCALTIATLLLGARAFDDDALPRDFRTVYRTHFLESQKYSWAAQLPRPRDPRGLPSYNASNVDDSFKNIVAQRRKPEAAPKPELDREGLDYLPDSESDIDVYLETITTRCAGEIEDPAEFSDRCWGYMMDLCRRPRCTTRFDSRVDCGGGDARSAEEVIRRWHDEDSTNVVIIGAGPVGLFLANALTGVRRPINVLVFESRLIREGQKRPYSRDWTFQIFMSNFERADGRILEFLKTVSGYNDLDDDAVFGGKNIDWKYLLLPIFMYETMLLLSNRSRGVHFIYGDYRRYKDLLAEVPNLVVFDATGHRLTGPPERSTKPDRVKKWTPPVPRTFQVDEEALLSFRKSGSAFRVAQSTTSSGETIFYPVDSRHRPLETHTLKMDDYRNGAGECDHLGSLDAIREQGLTLGRTEICRRPCARDPAGDMCRIHCRFADADGTDASFRPELRDGMRERHPGFNMDGAYIMLTPRQYDAVEVLLDGDNHAPISSLPYREFTRHPIFREHQVGVAINIFSCGETAVLGRFTTKSFMYADPLVPKGHYDALPSTATVLRIGDSLFNGDSFIATGLSRHYDLIYDLAEELDR